MNKNTISTQKSNQEPKTVKKSAVTLAKEATDTRVQKWITSYSKKAKGSVTTKTYPNIPGCTTIKVDGVSYLDIYATSKGIKLGCKISLIPEELRPEGAKYKGTGFFTPVYEDVEKTLTAYVGAARKSVEAKAEAKEAKKAKKSA